MVGSHPPSELRTDYELLNVVRIEVGAQVSTVVATFDRDHKPGFWALHGVGLAVGFGAIAGETDSHNSAQRFMRAAVISAFVGVILYCLVT